MTTEVTLTAFKAIENHIKTLCLQEFPCGTGSWRDQNDLSKSIQREKLKSKHTSHKIWMLECSQHVPATAGCEKCEDLLDLINSPLSPWTMEYSWSKEAKSLRETAVKAPWLINENFVYSYFKTLNIVDEAVTEVDAELLKLKNLEELTLSANFITNVSSKYLPPSLKTLELCANNIDDIGDLCLKPPPLQHLGLGRNKLHFLGDYLSGTYWPKLVSLDLSYNDLCSLMDIIRMIYSLPCLRNLLLQGNPFCLVPGYRGYIVDCLRNLTVLDDKNVTVDEKNHYDGLARIKDLILDVAIVQLGVSYIRGLPCPPEIMCPEALPDYPVIERSYFIQFIFPMEVQEEEKQEVNTFIEGVSAGEVVPLPEGRESDLDKIPGKSDHSSKEREEIQEEKNHRVSGEQEVPVSIGEDAEKEETETKVCTMLMPVNTPNSAWEKEISLNWKCDIILNDLLFLRDFFKSGMDVNIVEQTIKGYPMEVETSMEKVNDQKEKKKKDSEKGKGKRKKEFEELRKLPPTFETIASFHVALDSFLEGEYECRKIFIKEYPQSQPVLPVKVSTESIIDKSKEKKSTPNKQKSETAKKTGKGKDKDEIEEIRATEVELTVKLHHWLSAVSAVEDLRQFLNCPKTDPVRDTEAQHSVSF